MGGAGESCGAAGPGPARGDTGKGLRAQGHPGAGVDTRKTPGSWGRRASGGPQQSTQLWGPGGRARGPLRGSSSSDVPSLQSLTRGPARAPGHHGREEG